MGRGEAGEPQGGGREQLGDSNSSLSTLGSWQSRDGMRSQLVSRLFIHHWLYNIYTGNKTPFHVQS